ncbi:hypothetical protein [Streptomyces sp. BE303]|uniref:hypothetical protein n=1 Tax=Streptomycetaceae TaxID=2062 RepID=UPI002E783C5C|nr:hypothetical protein [Streptomyces sp. BE303]MED7951147.1 hypothetical protein [Streptomyces sp. BE303]
MRRTVVARTRTGARIRLRRRWPQPVRRGLPVLAGGLGWWLLAAPGQLPDGAVPVLLAAGGWGLGLIPVHADRNATGPARRRTGEPTARAEAESPVG